MIINKNFLDLLTLMRNIVLQQNSFHNRPLIFVDTFYLDPPTCSTCFHVYCVYFRYGCYRINKITSLRYWYHVTRFVSHFCLPSQSFIHLHPNPCLSLLLFPSSQTICRFISYLFLYYYLYFCKFSQIELCYFFYFFKSLLLSLFLSSSFLYQFSLSLPPLLYCLLTLLLLLFT